MELIEMLWKKLNDPSVVRDQFHDPSIVTLYGEGYGGKIQKGAGYRDDESFIMFDVNVGGVWLTRKQVKEVGKGLCVDVVPVVGGGTVYEAIDYVRNHPVSLVDNRPPMEGLVIRPKIRILDHCGNRIIEKVKVRDYEVEVRTERGLE
jgi:hypothetical protein